MNQNNTFELFLQAGTEQQAVQLQDLMNRHGYSYFYNFLDSFKTYIKNFRDEDM